MPWAKASYAANVGGRMLGAGATFIVTHLAGVMPGATPGLHLANAACVMGMIVYATNLGATFFMPEPPATMEE